MEDERFMVLLLGAGCGALSPHVRAMAAGADPSAAQTSAIVVRSLLTAWREANRT
jgi:hypothetical protein